MKMSKKRELLRKEIEQLRKADRDRSDQWWRNIIILIAEILLEDEQ